MGKLRLYTEAGYAINLDDETQAYTYRNTMTPMFLAGKEGWITRSTRHLLTFTI